MESSASGPGRWGYQHPISTALDELFVGLCQIQAGKGALPYLPRGRFCGRCQHSFIFHTLPDDSVRPISAESVAVRAQSAVRPTASMGTSRYGANRPVCDSAGRVSKPFPSPSDKNCGIASLTITGGPSNPGGWSMVEQQRFDGIEPRIVWPMERHQPFSAST